MTIIFTYDGSFEGLLTAIYEAFYSKNKPDSIEDKNYLQHSIFCKYIEINTDQNKSEKVYNAIKNKISLDTLRHCFYAYLSEDLNKATYIYKFLVIAFKLGHKALNNLQEENTRFVYELSKRVGGEAHRMLGLLRFKELSSGIYYAPYEPDNNITVIISKHFVERLSDQRWIIHDKKRDIVGLYANGGFLLSNAQSIDEEISENEKDFKILWKNYYKTIGIKERVNPKLKISNMPKKYWKYLTEII